MPHVSLAPCSLRCGATPPWHRKRYPPPPPPPHNLSCREIVGVYAGLVYNPEQRDAMIERNNPNGDPRVTSELEVPTHPAYPRLEHVARIVRRRPIAYLSLTFTPQSCFCELLKDGTTSYHIDAREWGNETSYIDDCRVARLPPRRSSSSSARPPGLRSRQQRPNWGFQRCRQRSAPCCAICRHQGAEAEGAASPSARLTRIAQPTHPSQDPLSRTRTSLKPTNIERARANVKFIGAFVFAEDGLGAPVPALPPPFRMSFVHVFSAGSRPGRKVLHRRAVCVALLRATPALRSFPLAPSQSLNGAFSSRLRARCPLLFETAQAPAAGSRTFSWLPFAMWWPGSGRSRTTAPGTGRRRGYGDRSPIPSLCSRAPSSAQKRKPARARLTSAFRSVAPATLAGLAGASAHLVPAAACSSLWFPLFPL